MATRSTWMVRAGEGGRYLDDFLADKAVGIGWQDAGRIEPTTSDEEIQRTFSAAFPDWKEGSRRSGAAQVKRFLRELEVGDGVATYDPDRRLYILGAIAGQPEWQPDRELSRRRGVTWTKQVSRDVLSASARNTLGSTLALFRIDDEVAKELFTKASPFAGPRADSAPENNNPDHLPAADPVGESEVIADAETKAQSFVEDRLARLDERQMPEIIAAILRAMGYKTRVSEPGPDRGVDIFASPDGLGLQEPRIFVEVKHRHGAMGSKEIRSFLGGRKTGDRCLYVSTGGFTRDAKYEADRSATPLTLLTMPQVRQLLLDHYEKLDSDARALIPLRRVYLPIPE